MHIRITMTTALSGMDQSLHATKQWCIMNSVVHHLVGVAQFQTREIYQQ